ncbi:hypothetical protein [Butyrivibrio sp. MC2013]|uniref:hypothetical protein n=1 Tax=Butyrivibrio sp. MC2013 TaxID=1280686 RepID=UPI00047D0D01|nr:hypothetical protein [Butyrivibrio sp. MC2013]
MADTSILKTIDQYDLIIISNEQDLILLVKDDDIISMRDLLVEKGFVKTSYKYNTKDGYLYRYGAVEPIELHGQNGSIILQNRLLCHSLTPKNIIPLDRAIQTYAWEHKISKEGLSYLDPISNYINRLVYCVFECNHFDSDQIQYFENNKIYIDNADLYPLIRLILYSYTDRIIEKIRKSEYATIYSDYLKWTEY